MQVGLGRTDGFYRPDAVEFLDRMKKVSARGKALDRLMENRQAMEDVLDVIQDLSIPINEYERARLISDIANRLENAPKNLDVLVDAAREMSETGLSFDDFARSIRMEVDAALRDRTWTDYLSTVYTSNTKLDDMI